MSKKQQSSKEFLDKLEDNYPSYSLNIAKGGRFKISEENHIIIPQTTIDRGYNLPLLDATYNLKSKKKIKYSGYYAEQYVKINPDMKAYAVFAEDDCETLMIYEF